MAQVIVALLVEVDDASVSTRPEDRERVAGFYIRLHEPYLRRKEVFVIAP